MDTNPVQKSESARYFVMTQSENGWVKVSREFESINDAREALESLRASYPFARLGGQPVDH